MTNKQAASKKEPIYQKEVLPEGTSEVLRIFNFIKKRNFESSEILNELSNNTDTVQYLVRELELRRREVFRNYFQNEFEAEKHFTTAALKYYWKEIPTTIHYLFNIEPS